MEPAHSPAPAPAVGGSRRSLAGTLIAVGAALALIVGATVFALGQLGPRPSPAPSSPLAVASASSGPAASAVASLIPSAAAPTSGPVSSAIAGQPIASSGSIAVVAEDGSLWLVTADGASARLAPAEDASFGFPAWSPDGSRVAAIRYGSGDTRILVFDPRAATSGTAPDPVTILRSSSIGPFYLSWTPDSRSVAFLAEEGGALSLRIAPADGSAPVDGSAPGSTIKSGNPFYFDWIERDRLLAHVGTGASAFLGEIGLDGASASPPIPSAGDFRWAAVSADRAFVSFVRQASSGSAEVVVAARDGSTERTMPVFGTAAVTFAPMADTIASLGPSEPVQTAYSIPFGEIRLLDARSGTVRTLLDGSVVSFWWSPDGKTIAALRVQPVEGAGAAPGGSPTPSAPPSTGAGAVASPSAVAPSASASAWPVADGGPPPLRRRRLGEDPGAVGRPARPALHRPVPDVLRPVRPHPPHLGAGQLVRAHPGDRPERHHAPRRRLARRWAKPIDRRHGRVLEPLALRQPFSAAFGSSRRPPAGPCRGPCPCRPPGGPGRRPSSRRTRRG